MIFVIGLKEYSKIEREMHCKMLRNAISFIFKIRYGRALTYDSTFIRRCKFRIENKFNSIFLGKLNLYDSSFIIEGSNNKVSIDSTVNDIYKLSVKIYGKNNELKIKENARIYGLRIVIRGERCSVIIGEHFSENINCMLTCMGKENYILIGDDCMLSENVDVWNTDSHQITDENGSIINDNKPIVIGNHVWIGKYASILKGVSVGSGSIIGMSSVVTKNVEPNSIYAGNPARRVKESVSWNRNYMLR